MESQAPKKNVVVLYETEDDLQLGSIYRNHRHWLIAFLMRRFGRDVAEDLAQDAFLRAAQAGTRIRNPRAFLAQVALSAGHDQHRRSKARPILVGVESSELGFAAPSQAEAILLKEVILALPPKLREVFVLSRFGGLTYEEIARRCGISVKTVEARMTKALALCARALEARRL